MVFEVPGSVDAATYWALPRTPKCAPGGGMGQVPVVFMPDSRALQACPRCPGSPIPRRTHRAGLRDLVAEGAQPAAM